MNIIKKETPIRSYVGKADSRAIVDKSVESRCDCLKLKMRNVCSLYLHITLDLSSQFAMIRFLISSHHITSRSLANSNSTLRFSFKLELETYCKLISRLLEMRV